MKPLFVVVATLALCLAVSEGFMERDDDEYVKFEARFGERIVGGEVANITDLPYQVAILRDLDSICGGAIIAAKAVLTAGHCVDPRVISRLDQLSIRAGSTKTDSGGSVIQASGILRHEDYFQPCWECTPKNDIALVFLAESAIGAGGVASVIPPADSLFAVDSIGVISGWGAIAPYDHFSSDLLRADLSLYDQAECEKVYGDAVDSTYICAGVDEGGKGPCTGDSGGPYAINGQLVGIVSFGYGCAQAGFPAVFTNIAAFREWIRTNAGI